MNRKISNGALSSSSQPRTPGQSGDTSLDVGDSVNVPGEMYGTVRFIGSVKGKQGSFVGVELAQEFAARGKNNGDVEGLVIRNITRRY